MASWRSPHDKKSGAPLAKKTALSVAIALSVLAFVIQLLGAWYTGSLALLGDTAHLMTDLFSLSMSLAALLLASRPTTEVQSFGLYRLEVLASFVNGLLLLAVSVGLAWEGIERLRHPEPVQALPLVAVAVVGLLLNLASAGLLHRASQTGHEHHPHHGHDHGHDHSLHGDRNLQSALLHVWSDALSSVAVILGALVMEATGKVWIDSVVGILLALLIFHWSVRVLRDAGHVLLEGTPKHVQPDQLLKHLLGLDVRIKRVDDLHVWEITSRMYAATAEVWVREMSLAEAELLRQQMHQLLHDKFGIAHVVLAIRPMP